MKRIPFLCCLLYLLAPAYGQELKDTGVLKEAVITGKKPLVQQRPDGIVINVESSMLTKGSSVLEILQRSPGVIINRRNNSISLNGKEGVMVMINGKLMRMSMTEVITLLEGMSADDIEKIELLSTPPARYDAEGSAGLINIVLKKSRRRGTSGNMSITGGYGWGEKGTAGMNLAHNGKTMDIYGSYTFSHDRSKTSLYIPGTNDFPVLGGPLEVLFLDTTRAVRNSHNVTLGWEARVTPRVTVGGSIIFGVNTANYHAINNARYNVLPDSLLLFEGYVNSTNHWRNLMPSVWVEKNTGAGEKISFNADYLRYDNNNPSDIQSTFTDKYGRQAGTNNDSLFSPRQRGMARTTIEVGVIKTDYEKQMSKKTRLEAGVKGTYTQSASTSGLESVVDGEWVRRTGILNNIRMKEGIGAAYASFSVQPDSVTHLTIGVRYEYARTRLENGNKGVGDVDRRLGVLFPNISFSRKTSERSEVQLSYTKRISRPTYNDLASFVGYVDPVAVFTGNPLLQPTITSNIKLGYNIGDYAFSVLASRDENPIQEAQLTENPTHDLMYVSPQNMVYRNSLTLQATLPWKVNDWWNMSYSLTGGWNKFKETYTAAPAEKSYLSYSFNFSQRFKLPDNFSLELSGWWNSPTWWGTIRGEGFGSVDAGVKKELKNNKGTLQLSAADVFSIMQVRMYFGMLTREAFATTTYVKYNPETRIFPILKLTYSRSFGTEGKARRKPGTGSQDEIDRIRKN
ncbi:MAG: TonB-dependent receptor [Chitinophagaceae bacterium]|nr:TonB-dependent receptor [Chitinophagaceae bacterium]